MNSKKKNIRKTSGTRKIYKPGQYDCNRFDFCIYKLPSDLYLKPI